MAGRHKRWAALAAALWLCLPMARAGDTAPATHAGATPATAAFDTLLDKLTGPASLQATSADYERDLERLRGLLPAGDRARDARFRSVYCGSLRWKDPVEGLAYAEGALALARDLHDTPSQARALLCRAAYTMLASGSRRGLPDLDKAIGLLDGGREPQLLAESLESRGDLLSLLGEQARAMLDFQRARAAYRQAGISGEVEPLVQSIAVAYRRMGDTEQARRYLDQALARMRARGDWESVATNLIQIGFLHDESGAPQRALASFQAAIDVAVRHRLPASANAALLGLAEAQITLGQGEAARHTLERARAGFDAQQDASAEDTLLLLEGQALARLGRDAEALDHYRRALPLIKRNGNDRYLALLYKAQAASLEALGHVDAALSDYRRYTELELQLQRKMRLQQGRLLEYEYEARRNEFENRRLRAEAQARQAEVEALERERGWQWLALVLGGLLLALLSSLAWRHWRTSRQLHRENQLDPLTGIANRAAIEAEARRALQAAAAGDGRMAVLMLDLDHFKEINDRHGHAAGDRVLRAVTDAWQAQLRGRDPIGRIGGEEFVVVCADTSLQQALAVAERLRVATTTLRFDDIDPELRVTASIGAARMQRPGDSHDALLARADAALYRAKQRGRDRVEC